MCIILLPLATVLGLVELVVRGVLFALFFVLTVGIGPWMMEWDHPGWSYYFIRPECWVWAKGLLDG